MIEHNKPFEKQINTLNASTATTKVKAKHIQFYIVFENSERKYGNQ